MKINSQSRLIGIWLAIFFLFIVLAATHAGAEGNVQLEGTIKGLGCTLYKVECINEENFIALEPDFVLVLPDGQIYFLPNISILMKARYAFKNVRVSGRLIGRRVWVDQMVELENGKAVKIWNFAAPEEFWESR